MQKKKWFVIGIFTFVIVLILFLSFPFSNKPSFSPGKECKKDGDCDTANCEKCIFGKTAVTAEVIQQDIKGHCSSICVTGQICSNGKCVCLDGKTDCGGILPCVNLKTDILNCGSCKTVCKAYSICDNGECKCKDDYHKCPYSESCEQNIDFYNCGPSCEACPRGQATCDQNSGCVCNSGTKCVCLSNLNNQPMVYCDDSESDCLRRNNYGENKCHIV